MAWRFVQMITNETFFALSVSLFADKKENTTTKFSLVSMLMKKRWRVRRMAFMDGSNFSLDGEVRADGSRLIACWRNVRVTETFRGGNDRHVRLLRRQELFVTFQVVQLRLDRWSHSVGFQWNRSGEDHCHSIGKIRRCSPPLASLRCRSQK